MLPSAVKPIEFDFIVVGAGIAGASIGYWLAPHGRTLLLERESQPGYHATGRSAALFMASYGPPQVRALTQASHAFLANAPMGFSPQPLLTPRGALFVAAPGDEALLEEHWEVLRSIGTHCFRLNAEEACAMVPILRRDRVIGALFEPDASDIDVDALHQGYLRGLKRQGSELRCDAQVNAIVRADGVWRVRAGGGEFRAPVLVNAAGAWCDEVAALAGVAPIGLVPRRRSAFLFDPPAQPGWRRWPLCIAMDHSWYFKPDAGMLLGSPANEDATHPQDVQPEEFDIAMGIHRIQEATTMSIPRPGRRWAGLRSFAADGCLVGGFDPGAPGFFWLAGQGGYGIQTSAAMGQACAAIAVGSPVPASLSRFGFDAATLAPQRLR